MTPKLNSELSAALRQQSPLEVQDERGELQYVIMRKDEFNRLLEHDFQQWLKIGLDQADRGEVAEWDTDEMLAEARRRFLQDQA